jgi:hypothetical protein
MLDFFKDYTLAEVLEDLAGAVLLFAMIPLFPYAVAIVKALL